MNLLRSLTLELRSRGLRFVLVGLLNSAFGYACYAACTYLGFGYFWSGAASMICGTLFNYVTSRRLVFKGWDGSFVAFAMSYSVALAVSVVCLEAFGRLGISPYVGGILVAVPAAIVSYVLQRFFVFRKADKG